MTITLDLNQFQAKDQNFFTEMLPYVSPAIRNIQRQQTAEPTTTVRQPRAAIL